MSRIGEVEKEFEVLPAPTEIPSEPVPEPVREPEREPVRT